MIRQPNGNVAVALIRTGPRLPDEPPAVVGFTEPQPTTATIRYTPSAGSAGAASNATAPAPKSSDAAIRARRLPSRRPAWVHSGMTSSAGPTKATNSNVDPAVRPRM